MDCATSPSWVETSEAKRSRSHGSTIAGDTTEKVQYEVDKAGASQRLSLDRG